MQASKQAAPLHEDAVLLAHVPGSHAACDVHSGVHVSIQLRRLQHAHKPMCMDVVDHEFTTSPLPYLALRRGDLLPVLSQVFHDLRAHLLDLAHGRRGLSNNLLLSRKPIHRCFKQRTVPHNSVSKRQGTAQ
jgi:hypothetical protein